MIRFNRSALLAFVGAVVLSGCASQGPVPYRDIQASAQLRANAGPDSDKVPYSYATAVQWSQYDSVIVEPVVVYAGIDQQFEGMPSEQKQELAQYMDSTFRKTLGRRFQPVTLARSGTLRVKFTLTGAKANTPVVSTVTRFDLMGGPINAVQSIRGKEGVFIGHVSYSVEIYDATSNRLLKAFVTKQYPNAMNIGATLGRLSAAKTGIDKGAADLLEQLQ